MKILFWNCRGLGRSVTQDHLRNQLRSHNPDVVMLSETFASEKVALRVCRQSGYQSHHIQPPDGRRNGFLILWSKAVSLLILFSTSWLLEMQLSYKDKSCYVIFIHADSKVEVQEKQWELIESIQRHYTLPWTIIGDFNAMLSSADKRGGNSINRRQLQSFASFIDNCNLCELPIKGPQFTWTNGQSGLRRISEKIDRGFVSSDFFDIFPSPSLYSQVIQGSDHCPMLLELIPTRRRRLRPFRFEALWTQEESCTEVVSSSWQRHLAPLQLSTRLSILAFDLRKWNKDTVGNIHNKLFKVKARLLEVQEEVSQNPNADLVQEEKMLQMEYSKLLRQQETLWFQKSRILWLKCGDLNTSFFHKSTLIRRQKNFIHSLHDSNVEIVEQKELENHILTHFQSLFRKQPRWKDLELPSLITCHLNEGQNSSFCRVPSQEEIWDVISSMGPYKAPGPDGFPALFYQRFWDIIGKDVITTIQGFFQSGIMPDQFNHTYITLIPKVNHPRALAHYRPISLCNVVYKIIAKLLAKRMRPLLNHLVSPNQAAFVPGRHITDNVLLHHEVTHFFQKFRKKKKKKKKNQGRSSHKPRSEQGFYALKLDFSKAYDKVDWYFLNSVLKAYGFTGKSLHLIMQCVQTVSFSVLVNGTPVGNFQAQRGLRQGDPLSPYLFILCQQVLSLAINRAELDQRFHGVKLSRNGPSLTHLMFADDIIIYGLTHDREAHGLIRILHKYCAESGQELNFQKSAINFSKNTPRLVRQKIRHMFNIPGSSSYDKYLGLPVIHKKPSPKDCQELLERVTCKLSGWKAFLLSQMGRTTLIQSVLNALPNYFMSCYMLPKKILCRLDQLSRQFFWKKGKEAQAMPLVCWDQITLPWRNGGLNVRRPEVMNKALLLKVAWRLQTEHSSLWAQTMGKLYFPDSTFINAMAKPGQSYVWRQLQGLKNILEKGIHWVVANGSKIHPFQDCWLSNQKLLQPPQDSGLAQPLLQVSELISENHTWNSSLINRLWPAQVALDILATPLAPLLPQDKQVWSLTSHGNFTVSSAYRLLLGSLVDATDPLWLKVWHLQVPARCRLFLWKSLKNAIPTAAKVFQRTQRGDPYCTFCKEEVETVEHLWLCCPFSRAAWLHCIGGSIQSFGPQRSLIEWLNAILISSRTTPAPNTMELISYVSIFGWVLWNHRNKVLFENSEANVFQVIFQFRKIQQELQHIHQSSQPNGERIVIRQVSWSYPIEPYIKLNFDGAWRKSTGRGSIGVIARDHSGKFLAAVASCCEVNSAIQAEALAALEALKLALTQNFRQIVLEGDSQSLVQLIQQRTDHVPWRLVAIIEQIQVLKSTFHQVQVCHTLREGNRAADTLANFALDYYACYWVNRPPSFLNSCIFDDARLVTFSRYK